MARGNIKGITIEFDADTSKLDKNIREVEKNTRSLDRELKQVNNSLKFNPKNIELLRQKQTLLTEKVEETTKKLDLLKQKQAQMDAKEVDKNSTEYRELQREIIKAENQQKAYNAELKKVKAASSALGQVAAKMKDLGAKAQAAGQALKPLSAAGAAVDAALAGLAYKSAVAADDLNTLSKVTGISTGDLQKYKAAADLVDVSVEAIAKSQTKLKKNMLSAAQGFDTLTVAEDGTITGGNATAQAFQALGVHVTDSSGHLRDQDEVFQETIEALGKMQNETERDALAMQIFGKSATELNPLIEDNGETYKKVADIFKKNQLDIVDQKTLDQANRFNDAIDEIKLTWTTALGQIGSKLAAHLAPVMEKVAEIAGKIAGWLSKLSPETLTMIGIIAGVVAAIAPVLIIIGKVATGISAIMSLMSTLGVSLGALAGPVGIVIGVIAALIAIGVVLYKNWDTIKAKAKELKDWIVKKWTELKDSVSNIFNSIKTTITNVWNGIKTTVTNIVTGIKNAVSNAFTTLKNTVSNIFTSIKTTASNVWNGIKNVITQPIEAAKQKVKAIIDAIKGFFSGLKLKLPHIKLPHFKISGQLSLAPPSVPRLSIDWYKKGGIFSSPTIAGIGEAGPEAVVPLDTLWKKLDRIADTNTGGGDNIVINVYPTPGMDVNQLVTAVKNELIRTAKQRRNACAY